MTKISLNRPILISFYGFPGSGKSYLARNLASSMSVALISADRLRAEIFKKPRFDQQENAIVAHLTSYMTEEFLRAGMGVAFDGDSQSAKQRRYLRHLADRHNAKYILVWLQIDPDTAYARTQRRDRRTIDDKFAQPLSQASFQQKLSIMQNPESEDYLVISGKHAFVTQKNTIVSFLYREGLITSAHVQQSAMAKPGLVNLVPHRPAEAESQNLRNISIY